MRTAAKDFKMTELGPIPKDWDVKRLGELVEVYDGTHQTPTYVECGYPFYSVENITSNDFVNVKRISETEHKRLTKSHRIEKGDVLMTRIGSIGDCKYVDWDVQASYYVSLALLKQRGSPGIDMRYLALASESELFKKNILLNSLQFAIPQKINLGKISDVLVLYPPLPEQRKIAAALSDVDEMIAALEKLIEKKRKIKTGTMQRLLTGKTRLPGFKGAWVEKRLGDCADIRTGKRNGDEQTPSGMYPFFVRSQVVYRIDSYSFDGEAILVPGEGGIGSIFHYINGKFDYHQRVYKISDFTDSVCGKFLFHYLKRYFGEWALSQTVKATVDSLRLPTFENFIMIVPPTLVEQKAIAKVLGDMDEEIAALEAELAKTRQLKQGMMQELLTGKTRLV